MIKMIGQNRLQNIFDSYTLESLPKTLILLGQEGCGKKLLARNLAERLQLELVEVSSDVDESTLVEYSMDPLYKIYLIDLKLFKEKQQNQFLKFIEEPSLYSHIILTARSEIGVLQTILNRGIKFHFDEYTRDELRDISWVNAAYDNDLLFEVCKTPGQLLDFDGFQINQLNLLCNNIIDNLSRANYANTLGIYTKINYKEDYNKFDFNAFLNMLEYCSYEKYLKTFDEIALRIYQTTIYYRSKFVESNNPVKEQFMIHFLTNLWKEVHF